MVNPWSNPGYLLPPIAAFAINLVLIILVERLGRRSSSKSYFSLLLISVSLWDIFLFFMRSSADVGGALLWEKILSPFFPLTFLLYYHFTLLYTGAIRQPGRRLFISLSYLFIIATAFVSSTDLVVRKMTIQPYGYAPVLGPAAYLISLFAIAFMAGGGITLLRAYRSSLNAEEKNRTLYLMVALLFPIIGALLDGFSDLPPTVIWSNMAFCLLCSVAILKYHLLEMHVIIRKGLAYIFISAIIAIPYVAVLYYFSHTLLITQENWWIQAILLLFLAIILRPLYSWAQKIVDRFFYRERYDYLKALQGFTSEMRSIAAYEELLHSLVHLIMGAMRSSSALLFMYSEEKRKFTLAHSTGQSDVPDIAGFRDTSIVVDWLRKHSQPITQNDLSVVPELQNLAWLEKQTLLAVKACLIVPIKTRQDNMIGILVIGEKLSQQRYTSEDKQILLTFVNQIAVTIENIQLYEGAVKMRQNLETWFNSMSDCVIISGIDGKIQFMNKSASTRFGNDFRIIYQEGSKPTDLHESNYISIFDGREYEVVKAPLLNPDRTQSYIEVLRDVTERRQAEQKAKSLEEELNKSSRLASIGQLAAGVAHEINNPLTGVMGFSERALRKNTDSSIAKDLDRIYQESKRAAKVVQNLLAFARRREPKKQSEDINEIVNKALELRSYELRANNIQISLELEPGLPKVNVDFGQIQQVFLNVIVNAEQAMAEEKNGKKLTLKTENSNNNVKIIFSDTGPGIGPEIADKIFYPFFTTKSKSGGTGLGLSVSYGIISEHGGKIYFKKSLEKGAAFVIELPIESQ